MQTMLTSCGKFQNVTFVHEPALLYPVTDCATLLALASDEGKETKGTLVKYKQIM